MFVPTPVKLSEYLTCFCQKFVANSPELSYKTHLFDIKINGTKAQLVNSKPSK